MGSAIATKLAIATGATIAAGNTSAVAGLTISTNPPTVARPVYATRGLATVRTALMRIVPSEIAAFVCTTSALIAASTRATRALVAFSASCTTVIAR